MRCVGSRPETVPLAFETPSLVDEATYAVEAAVLGEADVVRLQRRLDTLEHRLATVEHGLPNRVYRKLVGPAKRVLRRGFLALDSSEPDHDLVQRIVRVELLPLSRSLAARPSRKPDAASTFPYVATSTLPAPNASSARRRTERPV